MNDLTRLIGMGMRLLTPWRFISQQKKFWKDLKVCRFSLSAHCNNLPLLQDRFLEYLKNNSRYKLYTENETISISRDVMHSEDLLKKIDFLSESEIPSFLYCLNNYRHSISSRDHRIILMMTDKIFSSKMCYMDKRQVFKCVHAWFMLCKGNTLTSKIYQEFLNLSSVWLTKKNNDLEHLVIMIFYASLRKKDKEAQNLVIKCLREMDVFINFLSLEELGIICNSSYKCSVKIKSKHMLDYISTTMRKYNKILFSDPAYLVTFVKALRLAKYYDYNFMSKMANKANAHEILKMNLTAKVHILAMYADALFRTKHFLDSLLQSCIQDTSGPCQNLQSNLRLKDISRFFWAVSYLNLKLSHKEINSFLYELHRSVKENHHLQKPEHFVGSLLSLWMMGHKDTELFKMAVTEDFMKLLKDKQLFRFQARLSLLLTCIQIEMPELLETCHFQWNERNIIPQEALKTHFIKRTVLKQVSTAVANLSQQMNFISNCDCFIPNLNILGVTVTSPSGKMLHIEVLDKTVCLHRTRKPHGLMALKLRLLKNLGHKVLEIRDDKFDLEKESEELYVSLDEQLKTFLRNKRM